MDSQLLDTLYGKTFKGGKFSCFEWKMAIHGKVAFGRLILLISKAINLQEKFGN